MRTLLIAGNWKMNPAIDRGGGRPGRRESRRAWAPRPTCTSRSARPSVFLSRIDQVLEGSPIGLGAQNMYWEAAGAYTGEVSGAMLVDVGCTHVILGHSERRHGLGETERRGQQEAQGRARGQADPDRLHRRDQGRAAGRADRGRPARPA